MTARTVAIVLLAHVALASALRTIALPRAPAPRMAIASPFASGAVEECILSAKTRDDLKTCWPRQSARPKIRIDELVEECILSAISETEVRACFAVADELDDELTDELAPAEPTAGATPLGVCVSEATNAAEVEECVLASDEADEHLYD